MPLRLKSCILAIPIDRCGINIAASCRTSCGTPYNVTLYLWDIIASYHFPQRGSIGTTHDGIHDGVIND